MELTQWAYALSESMLSPTLPRRWAHSLGVAERARSLAPVLGGDAALLEAAAVLHDIGYAPAIAATGFHPLDGARFLRHEEGADERVVCLVAHHSCAVLEAEERGLRDEPAGKALVDCSNPVGPGFRLLTGGGPSAARLLADAAPGARVVKAFNLCHVDVWRMRPPVFDGRPLAVPVCGDDEPALVRVRELVRDAGCEPVAAGGLERAGLLEATAALYIGLWVGENADVRAMAPPLEYAAGPGRP
ncbi:HD domain-containing protein [Streptomyces sp. NPDC020875]|uniref:HD domain-containing protein n=1 Tax=Streptomyces sp. NPDC020875 TaxID=3154898 RepID=UPI0033E54D6B